MPVMYEGKHSKDLLPWEKSSYEVILRPHLVELNFTNLCEKIPSPMGESTIDCNSIASMPKLLCSLQNRLKLTVFQWGERRLDERIRYVIIAEKCKKS
ncbi:hypothetical protein KY289_030251 [Solanum tuberosum]|nr:hypothetical protein KY289_030251 [Solanum tuberosum]